MQQYACIPSIDHCSLTEHARVFVTFNVAMILIKCHYPTDIEPEVLQCMVDAFHPVLMLLPTQPTNPRYDEFIDKTAEYSTEPPFNAPKPPFPSYKLPVRRRSYGTSNNISSTICIWCQSPVSICLGPLRLPTNFSYTLLTSSSSLLNTVHEFIILDLGRVIHIVTEGRSLFKPTHMPLSKWVPFYMCHAIYI